MRQTHSHIYSQIQQCQLEERITPPMVPVLDSELEEIFTDILSKSVQRRVQHIYENTYNFPQLPKEMVEENYSQNPRETKAKLGILFSGGLDSSVLGIRLLLQIMEKKGR